MIAARPFSSLDCVCLDSKQYVGRAKKVDSVSGSPLEREQGWQSVRDIRRSVISIRQIC